MSKKKYDVAAKIGEYTNRDGETKPKWLNVGAVIRTENGHALLLNKTFNPAGLAEAGRESIILSLFEPRDNQQQSKPPEHPPAQSQSAPPVDDFDDQDIPF